MRLPGTRTLRRSHRGPPQNHGDGSRTAAGAQRRTTFEISRRDGSAIFRRSRSRRGNSGIFARLGFTLADLGYEFPKYPCTSGETMNSFLRQRTDEGARRRLPSVSRTSPHPDRAGTRPDRKTGSGRLFPHRLGSGRSSAASRAFWCKAEARPPTARYAIRWASRRWIRWRWICCSSVSSRRSAANGRTSISTCPGRSARARHSIRLPALWKRGAAMTANVITYRGRSAARDIGKALGFDSGGTGQTFLTGSPLGLARSGRHGRTPI